MIIDTSQEGTEILNCKVSKRTFPSLILSFNHQKLLGVFHVLITVFLIPKKQINKCSLSLMFII